MPVRMGGMGVLSHRECAAHARAAAMESADAMLAPILDEDWDNDALTFISQGERCKVMLEARRDRLITSFGDLERKAMVENGSMLGRKWLTAIPFNDTSRLTDFEIQVGLHYRTLVPAAMSCRYCGHANSLGHDEVCLSKQRSRWTIMRHNAIVNAFADAVKSVSGTRVQVEPVTTDHNSSRRNDLLVWGSAALGNSTTEHDVKVYSLLGDKSHKTTGLARPGKTAAPGANLKVWDFALAQCNRFLAGVARAADKRAPGGTGKFTPLVFSAGGLVEGETMRQLDEWKRHVEAGKWAATLRRVSVGLVRVRARRFQIG